jgi:hypothetical protein
MKTHPSRRRSANRPVFCEIETLDHRNAPAALGLGMGAGLGLSAWETHPLWVGPPVHCGCNPAYNRPAVAASTAAVVAGMWSSNSVLR